MSRPSQEESTELAHNFPAASEVEDTRQPVASADGQAEQPSRILLADDDADIRDYLQQLLSHEYDVIAVADGEAAWAAVREHQPDLVLADVLMPHLDGYGLVQRLRADPQASALPIILLSARTGEEARVEGLLHGADDYLIKPFSVRELLARVKTHLELARARKAAEEVLRRSNEALEQHVRMRTHELEEAIRALRREVEERARVEEQLRFQSHILGQVNDAVIAIDERHCIIYINPAAERQYGVEVGAALGRPLRELYDYRWEHPEGQAAADEALARHGFWRGENIHTRRDGTLLHVESVVSVLKNDVGAPAGLFAVIRDITERKHREAALRESEARFRTLANAVPQVIWTNDLEGKAVYFNQRWFDYSGLTYEQSVGLGWQAIVHPDDALASVERWQRALAAGQVFEAEYRLRRADGLYRWHIGRNVPLRDDDGRITGWFGSATDIEDLKQAEAARRESDERFRLLVEGAHDYAMFLLDPDNRITFWSVGAERVFGWTEAEARGQSGAIIFTPEDRDRGAVEHEIRRALLEGRAEDRRWHMTKDGARLFLDGVLIRLDDETGNLRGFVKIGRDATVQRRAEEAVQRARDELELRVQERTAELIRLSTTRQELLQRLVTAQEDERRRIARELHDSLGQYLSALTLDLARVQAVEGASPDVRASLARLQAVASEIDTELDRLTMELRPPALDDLGLGDALMRYVQEWAAISGITVEVVVSGFDTTRLPTAVEATAYRIVQEALTNVRKHAQAHHVSLIAERRADVLRVIIEDDGVGFDVDAVRRDRSGGRQLGLIGMTERASLAGGTISIESQPGGGTTIYLHIPLADEHPEYPGGSNA